MVVTLPGALLVLALWAPAPRGAPAPEENKAFAEGLRLFEAGDARGAERSWRRGYAVRADPAFLVRIGEALERAGDPKGARDQYERYLRESPGAADRAEIEARIRRLSPAPGARAPDADVPQGELRPMPGAPGIAASSPTEGGAAEAAAPRPETSVSASAERRQVAQARDAEENPEGELRAFVDDRRSARSTMNVLGWAGVGVTVALLGTAAFFGASAAEKADDVDRLLLHRDERTGQPAEYSRVANEYEDAMSDGRRADRLAKAFAIGAGATALAAAALFVLDAVRGSTATADTVAARGQTAGGRPAQLRPRLGTAWPIARRGTFGPAFILEF